MAPSWIQPISFLVSWMIITAIWIIPMWRIRSRAGSPGWVSLTSGMPFVLPIFLWVVAFKRWPGEAPPSYQAPGETTGEPRF